MIGLNRPALLLRGCSWAVEVAALCLVLASLGSPAAAGVRVQGDVAAVRIDASQAQVREVLDGLVVSFGIGYRSSIALNDTRSGTYSGSLRQVLARVLDGYNFVIGGADSKLQVIVLGREGDNAIPAATSAMVPAMAPAKNPAADWRPRR
jgi:hypothetical protein